TAPIDICRARRREELYDAAESGEISDFPGVSAEYEAPTQPDLVLATDQLSIAECAEQVVTLLRERGFIE
ncbi:MAG TPA: adenylyl-sulfate kinase, partial [Pirellulaceae bacterium]